MASKNFTECARSGGKIVTKRTKNGKLIKICYDKGGGSHARVIRNNKQHNKFTKNEPQKVKKQAQHHKPATAGDLMKLKEHFDKMYKQ